ncbi:MULTISPECIES: LysR family transcriptional regulator [Cupriavidus]|jgi:DNA-binding transcriptional LysR family regulator|uniref:LysR family transcriptional regulator n=1 Tax=Cupriavidus metallidurans TaxID=119219 RepID=A0A482J493_9BURK|nr:MULTISPECIES: LysR family transcriptional regulator [Cupriavidus]KWR71450.1 LysR family transcriptional regulator [Cupriavidus sp. SHE]QBP13814.1 LysR family transcriptional regulator [Cupriavidus metallidurans]QWC91589.1 LysR family transcriptional regulator [Cupriavidus metallidurans]
MNTRQLRHFLALLDTGSLAAAAESVHLSQPALSRSIRALEDMLGVPLFDRNDRRLRPTTYAIAYAPRARSMLSDEKEGLRTLGLMQSGDLGTFSVGMGSSLATPILRPMLAELLRTSPGLRLRSLIDTSERLLDALHAERIDFFVGDTRVAKLHDGLAIESIFPCTFGWYARRGHPLANNENVSAAQIREYPLIAPGYFEPSLGQRLAQLYELPAPVQDQFALISDDIGTVLEIVASTDAVVPLTDLAAISALKSQLIVELAVRPALELDLTLGIVRHGNRTMAPATMMAFEIIRQRFAMAASEIATIKGLAADR